ncbi:MAG: DegT/DnrJ/EryC1/StrS family aminotransferase [Burkholderiales bacterium]|nr:DegT/DnrJ/EryC1/StrS family aminotransferase [Burkholderiales bacterium]
MITEFIDLKKQYAELRGAINARIQTVLDHGQFIMGPEVRELEDRLAGFTGARHCITCASGTEALLIALMALDVRPDDEIITTPFTFVATAEVIALLGAVPVFVDVEPDTANIDATKIAAAITPRTRAIMPVSLYGQPADMDAINAIAARHKLPVIEDAAQSFGATYKGRQSGNLSTIGCTSFFPSKPLGCYGDGGALFTSDDALAKAMREIRVHGQERRYYHTRLGVGGRMDTIQCAVVLAKLERFPWEIERRAATGKRYTGLLQDIDGLGLLKLCPDRSSVYAQYTVLVRDREKLQAALRTAGVPTAVHYPLSLHQQPAYRAYGAEQHFPTAETLARQVLSLPLYPDIEESVQRKITTALADSIKTVYKQ